MHNYFFNIIIFYVLFRRNLIFGALNYSLPFNSSSELTMTEITFYLKHLNQRNG